jgi:hypothetical protein
MLVVRDSLSVKALRDVPGSADVFGHLKLIEQHCRHPITADRRFD